MDARTNSQGIAAAPLGLFAAYWGDMLWRTVASGEALRQRANNMTEHEAAGMPPTTEAAVIMLASHFYESRDGSTGGFFADNVQAGQQVWNTVNTLLRLDRDWKVGL